MLQYQPARSRRWAVEVRVHCIQGLAGCDDGYQCGLDWRCSSVLYRLRYRKLRSDTTRRPTSADRTARHQFQATGQPVSRTQASDAMTSRLLHYEAKCVPCRCFQWGFVFMHSDIKGTELPRADILIPLERQLIALQLCRWQFLYNETLQQTFRPLLSKLSKRRQI